MAAAMGRMGMSRADFLALTPEEFALAARAYNDRREEEYRCGWERTRWLAAAVLRPFVKGRVSPEGMLPLPWDRKRTAAPVTPLEEDKRRLKELLAKTTTRAG